MHKFVFILFIALISSFSIRCTKVQTQKTAKSVEKESILISSQKRTEVEQKVQQVAKKEKDHFLNKIPAGMEQKFGFHNREEIEKASVGFAIEEVTLNAGFMRGENPELVSTNTWRVPLQIDGQNKVLLTVEQKNGTWKAVDFGGAALSNFVPEKKENTAYVLFRNTLERRDYLVQVDSTLSQEKWQATAIPMGAENSLGISQNLGTIFQNDAQLVSQKREQ